MQLPQTLYGQLYLLAYDRNRHRLDLDSSWLLGFGLRAAMLTELLQSGYLADIDGKVTHAHHTDPRDPLLRSMFRSVDIHGQVDWAWMISADQAQTPGRVREQLESDGWLCWRKHRTLGIFPTRRLEISHEAAVDDLADRIGYVLHRALAGGSPDPRLLTLGLFTILTEMPSVFSDEEREKHNAGLSTLAIAAGAPLVGLAAVVESAQAPVHDAGTSQGGCGGSGGCGGCGGGCGGCGG